MIRLSCRCLTRRRPLVLRSKEAVLVRLYSSVDTTTDAEEAAKLRDAAGTAVKQQQPRPIFPWRHEGIDNLLPRLVPGKPECDKLTPFPTIQHLCAFLFLNVSFMDVFFTERWKSELAGSMDYAFFQGVAGIVSNVYKVPFDEVCVSNNKVDFSFPPSETSVEIGTKEGEEEEGANKENTDTSEAKTKGKGSRESASSNSREDYCPQVTDMLDRPLRNLFESAHESGRDQLRIKLEMQPTNKDRWLDRAKFFRLYAVPFVSREKLEEDPKFLKDLFNNGKPQFNTVYDLLSEHTNAQLNRDGRVQTTIAAEIVVVCNEIFQVVDAETGVHLQGSADGKPREILHVVTFAMTVSTIFSETFPYLPHTRLGRWQIVDIDDALGAKKWYHVERTE